jgi:hypothetical protein
VDWHHDAIQLNAVENGVRESPDHEFGFDVPAIPGDLGRLRVDDTGELADCAGVETVIDQLLALLD